MIRRATVVSDMLKTLSKGFGAKDSFKNELNQSMVSAIASAKSSVEDDNDAEL